MLAVAAPSASATPGFSLDLTGPSTPAVVNHPVVLQATAKNPPLSEYSYLTRLDVALAQDAVTVDVQPARTAKARAPRVRRSRKSVVCRPGRAGRVGWVVDGRTKPGAHRRKLRVTRALRGHKVACTVTSGGVTATSRPIALRR
jgi:hypothetical protein